VELSTDEGFKVGDWVMIGKHQGEKFRTRDNTLWIVISDTQYIAVLDDPAAFDCMSL
jgi:co-chaperonin GroES (HSP10)